MATITKVSSTNKISSSKAAEIYRKDCGAIYYQCYHCGLQFGDIADTLLHIDYHFSSRDNTKMDPSPMDIVDIKCELLDTVSQVVVNPSQLEQIFVDCGKSVALNAEPNTRIDTVTYTVLPVQQTAVTTKENHSDMEGHFEWKCLYCSSLWKKFTKLKQHLRTHSKEPLPKVTHHSTGSEHSGTIMVPYSFKCILCPSEFFDSGSSRQHVKDYHDPEPLKCLRCGRKFVSIQLLNDHMSAVHTNGDSSQTIVDPNTNDDQRVVASSSKTLLAQSNTFLCILCNKTFNGTLNLMQHTFVHFNLKNFSCPQCPAKFRRMDALKDHMMKKHASDMDENIFNIQCRFCDEKVEDLFEFVTHTFTNHLDNGEKNSSDLDPIFNYDCRFCVTNFNNWNAAYQHLDTHAKDDLPKCVPASASGRCFSERAKSGLYRSELLYNCTECTKALCGSFEARNHWITEHKDVNNQIVQTYCKRTEKANLKCHDCDDVFCTQFNLMKHRLTHFKVLPYRCMICETRFSVDRNATTHMIKIHNMKPDDNFSQLDCHYCNAEFTEEINFITHMYNEHLYVNFNIEEDLDGQCSYECSYCKEVIPLRSQMSKHLENHRNETIPETETNTAESSMNALRHKPEFTYCCIYCPKKFRLPHPASEHVKYKHKMEEKECLKCHDCDDTFRTQFNLMKHRLLHFKVQPYRCMVCAKRFSVNRNATIHMIKYHNMKPDDSSCQLDCHYCKAEFTEETSFIAHMHNEHLYVNFNIQEDLDGQCQYECLYCKEIVPLRSEMSTHLEGHRNETIPVTETTPMTAESSMNALRHKLEFLYCCVYCPKKFRLPHPAGEHVKYKHKTEKKSTQTKEKKPKTRDTHCSLCNITFLTWRSMLNHRAKRHPETHNKDRYKNRPTFYCSTCGKAYRDRGNLNQHEETHARLQSFTCDICNKTYRTKNYIQTHMLRHRNEKNFICEHCGRSFYSVSKLNTHYQIHQNLKLECDLCDKVFFTRYNLSKHKKTHTSDTRKKCELCGNYFKSTNSYRTHMLLHTGVKKYACRYCDMTFAQSSGRRGHEKMKHQIA